MLLVDTVAGRIIGDDELKRRSPAAAPTGRCSTRRRSTSRICPIRVDAPEPPELERLQRLFGYSREDLRLVIAPMATDGQEAIGSMGVDTPLAALSERPQLLSAYFKQHFAQVTNPAIDPQRETLVMSLRTSVGSQGNLLDESPEHARRVTMTQPVLLPRDLEKLRALPPDRFRIGTLECLFDASAGAKGLERALDELCKQASRLVRTQHTILVLSDRGADATRCPIPILLATAAVHSHLVREGSRTRCGLVVESGEPREVMHFALLIGYGAAAISPYLAFDSIAASARRRRSRRADRRRGAGALREGDRQGPPQGALQDGHLDHPELPRRADLRGRRARAGGRRALLHRHDLAGRRHRARADRGRRGRAPARSARPGGGSRPAGSTSSASRASTTSGTPTRSPGCSARVRDESYPTFRAFSEAIDEASARATTLRSLLELLPAGPPVPLDEVEPSSEIVRRFATGAMSLGSISSEAHETLAIAMNRLGARSNTGEGGEDPRARRPTRTATCGARRSSRSPPRASASRPAT